eukprot:gene34566-41855_t
MAETSYDKQWRWKQASLKKAEKLKAQSESVLFAPHFYTQSSYHPPSSTQQPTAQTSQHDPQEGVAPQLKSRSYSPHPESAAPITASPNASTREHENRDEADDVSSTSDSDEPIVELLERERRQWQSEREKLIQCIHLQQLELSQRSVAAQERAVEIAKDFAQVIEAFEERLITIETNVQREISSLKTISEALLAALSKSHGDLM